MKINTKELVEVIKKLSKFKIKSVIPSLEGIKLEFDGVKATFTRYNMETCLKVKVDSSGDPLKIIISDFSKIIKACSFFKDFTEITENKNDIQFSDGIKKFKILKINLDEYPKEIDYENGIESWYNYNSELLNTRYKKIKHCISKNDRTPVCQGVHFDEQNIFAVDGYRLAIDTDSGLNIKEKVIVGSGLFELSEKIFNKAQKIKLGFCRKYSVLKSSEIFIATRNYDGNFIDYKSIRLRDYNCSEINSKEFIEAIKYLGTFSAEKTPVIWNNNTISYCNSLNGADVVTENCTLPIPDKMGFNIKYILEALAECTTERLEIRAIKNISPLEIVSNNTVNLILPIRLKD